MVGVRHFHLYLYLGTDLLCLSMSLYLHLMNRKYLVPVHVPVSNVPELKQVQIRYMSDDFFYFQLLIVALL